MVEKNPQRDIINLIIHDESRTGTIGFNALTGDTQLGFVELKLTAKNDTAYNAMVSAASIGLERSANVDHQVHVRYDSSDRDLMK
jgi:hypothetical protein